MSDFISELDVAERFYLEQVQPILSANLPGLRYAAALIGEGSGVLGFDTARSRDHDWGPRLHLFVADAAQTHELDRVLDVHLPETFLGYPVRFSGGDRPSRHHASVHPLGA